MAGTGSPGYGGDGGPASLAKLSGPWDVAVDASGNLVIADLYNNRLRVVAVSASNPGYTLSGCSGLCRWAKGDIYTLAGIGSTGYGGDGGPASGAGLNEPQGVAVDDRGNLLLSDSQDNRVRLVTEGVRSASRIRHGRSRLLRPSFAVAGARNSPGRFLAPFLGGGQPLALATVAMSPEGCSASGSRLADDPKSFPRGGAVGGSWTASGYRGHTSKGIPGPRGAASGPGL